MNAHPHNASASSNGSVVRKPKGIYLLSDLHLDQIYGPDAQAEISKRVDISTSLITAESYKNGDQTWPGVEIIFSGWGMTVMNEEFLSRFPDLKIVFYGAGSVKPHVTEAFWKSGIRITNAAAANAIPVAEYTCSQIIQGLKRGWQTALYIRSERKFPEFCTPPGAFQTTVGLLSLGMVGRMVADRLRNHDLKIVAYDPYVTPEQAEALNVQLLSLSDVFAQANVVSCHMPWLPETRRVLRGQHFKLLKPHATFINTARGAVVAEDEMIDVLQTRPDILAILDVTYPEPPVEGSPLYSLDNVILTPHIAGSMGDECRRMGRYMVEELDRFLSGRPLRNELTDEIAAITA
jgi:phosphoglycerate dehydrogenase-like enzyme